MGRRNYKIIYKYLYDNSNFGPEKIKNRKGKIT